jgi:transcription elongation GreA/GreB family factor
VGFGSLDLGVGSVFPINKNQISLPKTQHPTPKTKMNFKQSIHARYLQLVQDKIDAFRDMISALSEDSKNDAKGSAGDKHETALSMMHIEQEKLNMKLREFIEQKNVLDKISASSTGDKVALGSLVLANESYLYISAALPKITVDDKMVIALSPQSPLGQHLMGKTAGESFQINSTTYTIKSVI